MSSINANDNIIALVDCDNFFVSCEKVFNPSLKNQPVVVLSGKNGIVLARSKEAKPLVPMGALSFQYKEVFHNNAVIELSTNFSLYSNMSERVMTIINDFGPNLEIYSIDEAFLDLQTKDPNKAIELAKEIQKRILKEIGIPVSIGLAPTKTLAKAATYFAKKRGTPILLLPEVNRDLFLQQLPIQEVWGIGSKTSEKLKKHYIHTAFDLIEKDDTFIKKHLTIVGLRIAFELRGISCDVEEERSRKSVSTYRTLPGISSLPELSSILARYTAKITKILRREKKQASYLVVSIATNTHSLTEEVYSKSLASYLPEATSYTPYLIKEADKLLKSIYKPGLTYKKLGVLLDVLSDEEETQTDLFLQKDPKQRNKEKKLMEIVDNINEKFGEGSLFFASEQKKTSPSLNSFRYTSCWKELLKVRA